MSFMVAKLLSIATGGGGHIYPSGRGSNRAKV